WRPGQSIELNLVPQRTAGWLAQEKRNRPKSNLQAVLGDILPARLAQTLAPIVTGDAPHAAQLSNMSDKVLSAIETRLARWPFRPSGTEGYAKAEVTAGGISTAELSSRTMEAKRVPGLYCIGECVDVTGWLGGYNFQWAWASGVVAGETL
ncbi:MAG: NAD(P)/FAD-dependent oxidoreductase, partial [Pseudomonadota bacterium]